MSYLTDLVDLVSQPDALDHDQQRQVLFKLEPALRSVDPEERLGGRDILERFSSRDDVYADVDRMITLFLKATTGPETDPKTVVAQGAASPTNRTRLHKTVNAATQRELWDVAKGHLKEAEKAGYRDSETYGIWGDLLKRQLQTQRAELDDEVAHSLFAEMEQRYRTGFELDPDYYTGVNVVMALRWSERRRDDAFRLDFNDTLTVSRVLARRALTKDPRNFSAAVTLAELTLHEALEAGTASINDALEQYADAARTGRPDEIEAARFQLEFLRKCGDPDVINRMLAALEQAG